MLNVADLNALGRDEFVRVVAPVFEHSPWIAERAWQRRSFADRNALHRALCEVVRNATAAEKRSLIRAHPDLVGRAVLTIESQAEQESAGLASLTKSERQQFRDYNKAYRERFGFPFVICARLNKKQAILRSFPERLRNSRRREIETALEEIYKIASLRLQHLIG